MVHPAPVRIAEVMRAEHAEHAQTRTTLPHLRPHNAAICCMRCIREFTSPDDAHLSCRSVWSSGPAVIMQSGLLELPQSVQQHSADSVNATAPMLCPDSYAGAAGSTQLASMCWRRA
jgi:hypothetical protein